MYPQQNTGFGQTTQQAPGQQGFVPPTGGNQKVKRAGSGVGGAQGNYRPNFGPRLSFFNQGVEYQSAGEKRTLVGRLLPAHNAALAPTDPAYAESFLPYRYPENDQVNRDTDRGVPALTPWPKLFLGYRMFGQLMLDIASPRNLEAYQVQHDKKLVSDPISDIRYVTKKMGPNFEHLLKARNKKEFAIIPAMSHFYLFNFFGHIHEQTDKPEDRNFVAMIKDAGVADLSTRLAINTTYGTDPRDKNFPRYLYGDVTHPDTGLLTWTAVVPIGTITAASFVFSQMSGTLQGTQVRPVNATIMRQRLQLDPSIMNIKSYQEIVDMLVEDGTIPHELIMAGCSWNANIGPSRTPQTHFNNMQQPQGQPGGYNPNGAPQGQPWQPPQQGVGAQQGQPWQAPQQDGGGFTPPPQTGAPQQWGGQPGGFGGAPQPQSDYVPMDNFQPPGNWQPQSPQGGQQPTGYTPPVQNPPQSFQPPAPQAAPTPAPQPAPAPQAAPQPTPAVAPVMYYVTMPDAQVVQKSEQELRALLAQGQNLPIMPLDQSKPWTASAVAFGQPVATPQSAAQQAPPQAQQQPNLTPTALGNSGTLAPLTPDEIAKLHALEARVAAGQNMDGNELLDFKCLRDRKTANSQ